MRIMFAGDWHGDLTHARAIIKEAVKKKCDRIFVLGDFGYWEHMPEGVAFLDRLNTLANVRNMPIYFLDGNHDKTSLLVERYQWEEDPEGFLRVRKYIRYARRGLRWSWDDCSFIALGGAYSIDKRIRLAWEAAKAARTGVDQTGTQWFPEEEMTDDEFNAIMMGESVEPVDVILAHDKPYRASPGLPLKDLPECMPNQKRLDVAIDTLKPRLFLHGHLHHQYLFAVAREPREGEANPLTVVTGLNCNGAASPAMRYEIKSSYSIIDTEELKDGI